MKLNNKATGHIWIASIAVVTLIIHMITSKTLGFHRDELLYLELGRHLSTGYWSNPPFIGFMSYLVQLIPGDTLFVLRIFPAVAGMLIIYLTGLIAFELGGKTYAQVLACLSLAISILFLRSSSMFQPVCFDILFWTLILYLFLRYVNTGRPGFILLVGAGFGLGLLNKYMVIFLGAGLAVAVLATSHRSLWINRYTFLALLITLVIFLPNLVWQYTHGFPVFRHMQQLHDEQLVNVNRLNIVIEQLLMFAFSSIVWVAGLIWLLFSKKYRVFGFVWVATLLIFVVLRGKSYYMAGLYPFMFAAGGISWELTLKKPLARTVMVIIIILMALPMLPGGIPFMSPSRLEAYFAKVTTPIGGAALLRWEDARLHPLPQDYADMLGWDELGNIVLKATDSIKDKKRLMIFCDNYGEAGAVNNCGRCHGLPPAISFSDNYRLWAPDSIPGHQDIFLYVNDHLGRDVDSIFAQIDKIGSITNPYAREHGTMVYMCRKPVADFKKFWKERVAEIKNNK